MKFYIVASLLLFTLVFGQEVAPPDPDAGNGDEDEGSAAPARCFDGTDFMMVSNVTEVNCNFALGGACQTKIEQRETPAGQILFRSVVRVCSSLEACNNNAAGNSPKCSPGENNVRLCFFCCVGDLCNNNINLAELET